MIVDDEPLARYRIRTLLSDDRDFEIVGESGDGKEAVGAMSELRPDLVFLDVQMPEIDGLQVLEKSCTTHVPAVIFVTAYDRYAVQAFDAHAVDYLVKPFSQKRFTEAVRRVKQRIESAKESCSDAVVALLSQLQGDRGRLAVRSDSRILLLRTDEIEWIEAAANYVCVHASGQQYMLRSPLSRIETELPPSFLRVHRSVIVNLNRIREIQPCNGSEFIAVLENGKALPVGRKYSAELQNCFQLREKRPLWSVRLSAAN